MSVTSFIFLGGVNSMDTFEKLSLYSTSFLVLNCVELCLYTAAHFTVALSTVILTN